MVVVPVDAVPAGEGFSWPSWCRRIGPGYLKAQLTKTAGNNREIRRFAVNVDPAEGDLAALGEPQLAERLGESNFNSLRPRRSSRPPAIRLDSTSANPSSTSY